MLKRELFKRTHTQSFNEADNRHPHQMDALNKPSAEQAFKSALYNAAAVAFVIVCFGLGALLIILLQVFVRSILWALLTGAFLFSFKSSLTQLVRKRLKKVADTNGSLSLEIVILPAKLTRYTLDRLQEIIFSRIRQFLIFAGVVLLTKFLSEFYEDVTNTLKALFDKSYAHASHFVVLCDSSSDFFIALFCIYFMTILFQYTERTKWLLRLLAMPIWTSFLLISSKLMGSFRLPFLVVFFFLTFLGICALIREFFARNSKTIMEKLTGETSQNDTSATESTKSDTNDSNAEQESLLGDSLRQSTPIKPKNRTEEPSLLKKDEPKRVSTKSKSLSDKYFLLLFWLFIGTKLWPYICILPIIVALWDALKKIYQWLSRAIEQSRSVKQLRKFLSDWYVVREDVLAPKPFKELVSLSMKGDRKVNEWLQNSLDSLISLAIMLALLAFVVIVAVLVALQVQSESLELIRIYTGILNENLYAKPYLERWLPEKARMNELIQTGMNNLYIYGREWLSERLKSLISPTADQNGIEKQILAQWDLLYKFLSQSATSLTLNDTTNSTSAYSAKKSLFKASKNIWRLENYDSAYLFALIKDNIGIFVSLFDSLFMILKGNVNLILTILQAIFRLLFHGGFALLNFLISFIVYITALFYLLASSGDVYKPLQWLRQIKVIDNDNQDNQDASHKKEKSKLLTDAIEESISSVFLTSLKMSFFYGFYTWIIHSMFQVNIVYVPSILAAIFAFLPILGTYWASLPGVLELWLIENQPFYALCFLVLHILPTYVVDMAIYSDIKGSHPYLTGLAIAGGLYCIGLEGALIGPIVLCLLIVLAKMNLFLWWRK